MQKIEIKLPQIEGAELKNVTTNIENGYVVAEYGEKAQELKFKRGDIVTLLNEDSSILSVIIFDRIKEDTFFTLGTISSYNLKESELSLSNNYNPKFFKTARLSTPSEQQLLFYALAKEGKYWDVETLEVKDIPKEEIIKNIFRELQGHNISVNEAYRRMHKLIPING